MLPWDLEMTVEEPLSDDESSSTGSLTVSLTPSLNPKMTLTKILRHVTQRVSVYFFILSSVLFLYFIFTFLHRGPIRFWGNGTTCTFTDA